MTFTCSEVELCIILPPYSPDVGIGVVVASVISEVRRLVNFRLQRSVKQHWYRATGVLSSVQFDGISSTSTTELVCKQPYSAITVVVPLGKRF